MAPLLGFPSWQVSTLLILLTWVQFIRRSCLAASLRSAFRLPIARQIQSGVPTVLHLQKMQRKSLDLLFGILAVLVSKEFYTFFLPFLFWGGQCGLARQMTLLMAFSIYIGNCVKDTFSAPRPPSPPVRRFTATDSEKDFALEYGLPSSHTINTICLSGYLLVHIIKHADMPLFNVAIIVIFFASITILTMSGRLYLGMHSPIDVLTGMIIGTLLLAFWCFIDEPLDNFIINGTNVECFWVMICLLLLFAYPTPESPTPSFEFHTAFDGVALGVVLGVHRTYSQYHHGNIASLIVFNKSIVRLLKRLVIGFPIVLAAKVLSKEVAKILMPPACNFLGIPVKSSAYLTTGKKDSSAKQSQANQDDFSKKNGPSYIPVALLALETPLDLDTGIRLVQYASLGWSVVELVPFLFEYLSL